MKWILPLPLVALTLAADSPVSGTLDLPCTFDDGEFIRSRPYRECVALLPPERIRGTWFIGLEESNFLPEGSPLPPVRVVSANEDPPESATWLDADWPYAFDILQHLPAAGEGDTARYSVDFIGRRARRAGEYGHAGLAQNLIVLDRMISIRPAGRVRTWIELGGLRCYLEDCNRLLRVSPQTPSQSSPPGRSSAE